MTASVATDHGPEAAPDVPATHGAEGVTARLERARVAGVHRVLRYGAVTAAITMTIDGSVFVQTGARAYLLFATLAALVLVAVAYGAVALRSGRIDRAMAVPLVYVVLIAPVGPMFVASRALVSVALPFIGMAVAMNYGHPRHLKAYAVLSWASAVAVLALWQAHMTRTLGLSVAYAATNVATAALITGFTIYALSRYSERLHGAFTETRTAHADLAAAHAELRQVDAARVRFMNNAAHELMTPMTPIQLQMQILKRSGAGAGDARGRRSVEILERNFHRLQRLVNDILHGARMDAGRVAIAPERCDLGAGLREALEEYLEPAEVAGVGLAADIGPGLVVHGDPLRLRQVIDNLLSNALKFTPQGGSVRLDARRQEDEVWVSVTDSGIGIAPQDIPKLFQPFGQVHDPMKNVTGGSGLGLYISKGFVERHGGRIWAESAGHGHGTTITFCVPAWPRRATDASDAAAAADPVRPVPAASLPASASGSPT